MNIALIFAGGTGQRMNSSSRPKQFLELHGKPIIIYTLEHFDSHPDIDAIVVVCLESWIPFLQETLERFHIRKVRWVVPGGKTGQGSIRNGLRALEEDPSVPGDSCILVHDGVRPLINKAVISENIASVEQYGSAITTTPAIETIVNVNDSNEMQEVLDRSRCRLARAPQSYRLCDLLEAHRRAEKDGLENMIDSAMLMTHYGYTLHIIEGPVENIKITTPTDYYIFRAICDARENLQIMGGAV